MWVIKLEKLKEIRKRKSVSMQEIADYLKISKTFYWQIENKKRRLSYVMAKNISSYFGMKPDDLFFDEFQ